MTTVAFLTSEELRNLTADDRLAAAELEARGMKVVPAVWTDGRVDYGAFDAVVIRSTWDWHSGTRAFVALLEQMESKTRVFNRHAWEWLDKRYLQALAERGVRTVPMRIARDASELGAMLAECNDARVVLKPATSAGARLTARVDPRDAGAARVADAIFQSGDVVIVQSFVEAIETDGEWSLVFIDHAFSHALKKRAARGDFRVQEEFGGTVEADAPPEEVIAMAKMALDASGERFLYARVDGVVSAPHGGFCVTELEVVEPELFFRVDASSAARFADALARALE